MDLSLYVFGPQSVASNLSRGFAGVTAFSTLLLFHFIGRNGSYRARTEWYTKWYTGVWNA